MINQRNRNLLFLAIPLLLISVLLSIFPLRSEQDFFPGEETEKVSDLDDIIERGVLRAATDYNSTNYFVYRGKPMGYQLELLKHFATYLGVDLEVSVSSNIRENIDCLLSDNGSDLIAQNLAVTMSRRQYLSFATPHSRSHQVLVQRKPETRHQMSGPAMEALLVRRQTDLAGKTIHVQRGSAFAERLRHLMNEVGDTIYIVEMDKHVEELIDMVASGQIDYTVSNDQLARLNQMYYANIDTQTPLSFEQKLAWAIRPGADQLLEAINQWQEEFMNSRQYTDIYNRYFNNSRSVFIAKSEMHSLGGGRVSAFDDYFRRYADIVGWDWRLIASLSYQESRFNPSAVSWAGAFGIMQLMPGTAEFLNVGFDSSVQEHIAAGVRYLYWLDSRLSDEIPDDEERVRFVLASYNAGIGHVLDARRLAEKYGKDPNVWKDNVDYYLLNKSNPKYYLDPVVRHGFARGSEPYRYVSEILERFHHYKNALGG